MAGLCAAAVLLAGGSPTMAQHNLPGLGDTASEDFNLGAERQLGDRIMRDIRRDPAYLDDPVLLEYVQSVWQPLVAAARSQGHLGSDVDQRFSFEIFLVRDRSVNAFALPGGYVGLHLGLIAVTATRDELASVLAHELTHVTQRHIARGFANSRRQSLIGLASMIVGVLAATRAGTNPDAANAMIAGGQAVAIQGQLNFSRDMEREADRIGLRLLDGAGYSPTGMASMFEKLAQSSRLNDNGGFPYLRSHPLSSERIGEARARLGAMPSAPPALVLEHATAQARARVLSDTRPESLRRWQALEAEGTLGDVSEKLAWAYQGALASVLLRDWARAESAEMKARALLAQVPDQATTAAARRTLDLLAVEAAMARGNLPQARAALAPHQADGTRPVLLLRAQLTLAEGARTAAGSNTAAPTSPAPDTGVSGSAPGGGSTAPTRRITDELQTWVSTRPGDAAAWFALSQSWQRLGQPLRSVRADAEARYALGDLTGAVDRLRAGQALARTGPARDFIEASVIDARLRDIEVERQALLAQERLNAN